MKEGKWPGPSDPLVLANQVKLFSTKTSGSSYKDLKAESTNW